MIEGKNLNLKFLKLINAWFYNWDAFLLYIYEQNTNFCDWIRKQSNFLILIKVVRQKCLSARVAQTSRNYFFFNLTFVLCSYFTIKVCQEIEKRKKHWDFKKVFTMYWINKCAILNSEPAIDSDWAKKPPPPLFLILSPYLLDETPPIVWFKNYIIKLHPGFPLKTANVGLANPVLKVLV